MDHLFVRIAKEHRMLCGVGYPSRITSTFEAQVLVMDLPQHRPLLTGMYAYPSTIRSPIDVGLCPIGMLHVIAGFECQCHIGPYRDTCTITRILRVMDKDTGRALPKTPLFVKAKGMPFTIF
jgi:hypothetical protein